MKQIWKRIIGAGVRPDTSIRKSRFIHASNAISVIVGLWLLTIIPIFYIPFWPHTFNVILIHIMGSAALFLTPLINRAGWHRSAQFWGSMVSLVIVTFNAFHYGHDSWNHLFLLATILIAFNYIESFSLILATTIIGLSLFAGIEVLHVMGYRSPLAGVVGPSFFQLATLTTIYNLVGLTIGLQFYNRAVLNRTQDSLDRETARSESLLLNILPRSIAERLKNTRNPIAELIPEASIVFADLVGFTVISRKMDASRLVGMLNEIFIGFDRAAIRLGVEKIKTIGDAYMVAAGIPEPRKDHAHAAVEMAIAMQEHMESIRTLHPDLRLRIGIHTGPVVAGVIGESKFNYDLWGDSVNVASRMESHGLPGRIHVSEAIASAAADRWSFEDRGMIEIKGQGPMRTFLLVA